MTNHNAVSQSRWLTNFFLSQDPFALREADQERLLLSKVFVDRSYLHSIFGDPTHPQAAILMAGRGSGKTATREMVAYECLNGKMNRRVLPVHFTRFDHLLEQVNGEPERISIRHYVRSICREILSEIQKDISVDQLKILSEYDRGLLKSCAVHFADPITRLKFQAYEALKIPALDLDWESLTPLETFMQLGELVTHLPVSGQDRSAENSLCFCSIYILIDRVDETEAGAKAALSILRPLVRQGPLLNMPNIAFKFFLPTDVGVELIKEAAVPSDRMCIEEISWNEESLRSVIDQRLLYFSNGYISQFEELCSSGLRSIAMHRLVDACNNSPRSLINLCQLVVKAHLQNDSPGAFFDRTDLLNAIQAFNQIQLAEQAQESQLSKVTPAFEARPVVEKPPEKGLLIDHSGHIWIDGRQMTETFSEQEYRLLTVLYNRSPRVATWQELVQAVWNEDFPLAQSSDNLADNQNLRKLVARLRDRLEPDNAGKTSRFIKNAHGRGYWLEK